MGFKIKIGASVPETASLCGGKFLLKLASLGADIGKVQVLIADDEPTHLFLMEMFLKKWGYEVISSDNGTEAWQILQQENSPRLAILDWQLPGMDGIEICRAVRKAGEQPRKYILLLTARAQKADILRGKQAGADDYMTKPYEPEELQERLRTACQALDFASQPVLAGS